MELHHSKHHQAYVNGLNAAEDAYAKAVSPRDRIRLASHPDYVRAREAVLRFLYERHRFVEAAE